jgi:nucleoside-diphosphate-sugar epimerase
MRIFVTGATGWIGSAVIPELLDAGHRVTGLARTDSGAARVAALGAQPHRGDLNDLESLRAGAAASDGVVHLGYNHDFSRMEEAARTDLAAITTFGTELEDSGRPLVVASGVVGLASGRIATERDVPDPAAYLRTAGVQAALAFGDRGVRALSVRFAPTVHGPGDHGFVATLVGIAREKGVSAYIGEGDSRWCAVHRLDAAHLVRLAVDKAPAGTAVHAVAEEGVPTWAIAEAIGRGLGVPVVSVPAERAGEHFGWLARFFGADAAASSELTRELLGWEPREPGLIEDLDAGRYTGDWI